MLRLKSDLLELIEAALSGRIREAHASWDPRPAMAVVMAAKGYPGKVRVGDEIEGLDGPREMDVKVFHAGTRLVAGKVVSAGGRVLTVCGLGADFSAARKHAYAAVDKIHFAGGFHRRDIGHRALAR